MTIAEQLRAKGEERGFEKVAINLLKDGAEPAFVTRMTGLDLAVILKLKDELEDCD